MSDREGGAISTVGVRDAQKPPPQPVLDMKLPHSLGIDVIRIGYATRPCGYIECTSPNAHLFYQLPTRTAVVFGVGSVDKKRSTAMAQIDPANLYELSVPAAVDNEQRWIIARVDARDLGILTLPSAFTIPLELLPSDGELEVAFRLSGPAQRLWQLSGKAEITRFCFAVKAVSPKAAYTVLKAPSHSSGTDQALSHEYEEHCSRKFVQKVRPASPPSTKPANRQTMLSFGKRPASATTPPLDTAQTSTKKARPSIDAVAGTSSIDQQKPTTAEQRKAALLAAWESAEREIDEACDQCIVEVNQRAAVATAEVESTRQEELAGVEQSREKQKAALLGKLRS